MDFCQWLDSYRRLHEQARIGAVEGEDAKAWADAGQQLLAACLVAQRVTCDFRHPPRMAVRVASALQLDIRSKDRSLRAVTRDVSAGGFSTLLERAPSSRTPLEFSLRLPNVKPIAGTARVVAANEREGSVRVSCAFLRLAPQDIEHIRNFQLDVLLPRVRDEARAAVGLGAQLQTRARPVSSAPTPSAGSLGAPPG